MSHNHETLTSVLTNIKQNREEIAKQIVASTRALGDPSPEVMAAIATLIAQYGPNVQVIGQTIGAQLQIEQLEKTAVEINALIAALEVFTSEGNVEARLTQQMSADHIRRLAHEASSPNGTPTGDMVAANS